MPNKATAEMPPTLVISEDDERFTPEERRALRDMLREKLSREDQIVLASLIKSQPEIEEMLRGKRVVSGVYRAIGEFAKWAAAIIGVIIAYRTLIGGK